MSRIYSLLALAG